MNFKKLSDLTPPEREAKRKEIELELMKERAQIAAGTSPKNPGLLREHKKTLARIKTIEANE
jgi:large subunit ribosomal protein L29